MVVLGNEDNIDNNGMFDAIAYENCKYFNYEDYDSVVNHIYKQIKFIFKDKIDTTFHYKFDTHKSMDEIREIQENQNDLEYDDYYDLATFVDENNNYLCDLIILDGIMGVRYSKITDDGYENLTFEELNPNLENEITLMFDMQKKLDNFINEELRYSVDINENIKI